MTKDSGRTLPSADHPVKQPIAPIAGQSTRFRNIATAARRKIFSARIDGCGAPNRIAPSCTTIVYPMGHPDLEACRV